jgi:hypothetical protein
MSVRPGKTDGVAPGWRDDATWVWVAAASFVVLVILTAVLITAFRGVGFGAWLVMAAAIALGWLVAVVVVIPRTGPRGRR